MTDLRKTYLTAKEVAEILGVSMAYAYKIVKKLNEELIAKGYMVLSGKISYKYFMEKFYGLNIN